MREPTRSEERVDVAIVGGGPAGSTAGALLRKYNPELRVRVVERERFPRDHVGESQLSTIGAILDEMGCWDKIEAADFPIKIGATYRWGRDDQLWDFDFVPNFQEQARPAKFAGQRTQTAFQVERARYDEILLDHAEALGCEVRQGVAVTGVDAAGDAIEALHLSDRTVLRARYYIDASGHVGVLRRALGIAVDVPTRLKNIAIWDYWENASWAVELGVGGTRVQVMSLKHGWIWFIPLGPTRTSIGLICPAEYYRARGIPAAELYRESLASDARIGALIKGATARGAVETTTDWSFLSARAVGENWFLVGESIGFADPILAAGMALAHSSAREAAYTILALEAGAHEETWLKRHYDRNQRARIEQHIRFADFWYAANAQFSDLQEHCQSIARDAGLTLTAEQAWDWLARGGFTSEAIGFIGLGGLDLQAVKQVTQRFTAEPAEWRLSEFNVFQLELAGAERVKVPVFRQGTIVAVDSFRRGDRTLVLSGMIGLVVQHLGRFRDLVPLIQALSSVLARRFGAREVPRIIAQAYTALEVLIEEGWVKAARDESKHRLRLETPEDGPLIHNNRDPAPEA
ncbi:MAG: tryptophan 7-halogenase [Myxococcales bacterium]|nr:tryptophan 7-halogenase [Myxococcales bacterium]